VAKALGVDFAEPGEAIGGCDLVIHASASAAGLERSLELLADEGEVIELSWYGSEAVSVPLGSVFHPRRLVVRASQVSEVAASRRARRTHADRLRLALDLLRDDAFDALITGSSPFAELPDTMRRLTSGELPALCHVVDY
jgi:threonine dehydrogenase-like Zn-dependent dehydrogenase